MLALILKGNGAVCIALLCGKLLYSEIWKYYFQSKSRQHKKCVLNTHWANISVIGKTQYVKDHLCSWLWSLAAKLAHVISSLNKINCEKIKQIDSQLMVEQTFLQLISCFKSSGNFPLSLLPYSYRESYQDIHEQAYIYRISASAASLGSYICIFKIWNIL